MKYFRGLFVIVESLNVLFGNQDKDKHASSMNESKKDDMGTIFC